MVLDKILLAFQDIVLRHTELRGFEFGSLADVNDELSDFPLFFVDLSSLQYDFPPTTQTTKKNVQIDCYVLVKSGVFFVNEPQNKTLSPLGIRAEALSACEDYAAHVVWALQSGFQKYGIECTQASNSLIMNDFSADLDGVRVSFLLNVYGGDCGFENYFTEENDGKIYKNKNAIN